MNSGWYREGRIILAVYLMFSLVVGSFFSTPVQADETTFNVTIYGASYSQDGARAMLDLVNGFRQSEDAWYYTDNSMTEKTVVEGLGALTYDYGLEQIAMKRALELVMLFSHVRPDGSRFYDLTYGGISSMGENLAMSSGGMLADASSAFVSWQETDYGYDNQGHRRNMLKEDWAAVGIAHLSIDGYDFWVQEFSSYNSGLGDAGDPGSRTVRINTDVVSVDGAACAVESIEARPGETVNVPALTLDIVPSSYFGASFEAEYYPEWVIGDLQILTTLDGQFLAGGEGETTIAASVAGYSFTIPVSVQSETESSESSENTESSESSESSENSESSEIADESSESSDSSEGSESGSEAESTSSEVTSSETEQTESLASVEETSQQDESTSSKTESSVEETSDTSEEETKGTESGEVSSEKTESSLSSESSRAESSVTVTQSESASQAESSVKEENSSAAASGAVSQESSGSTKTEVNGYAGGQGALIVVAVVAAVVAAAIVIYVITKRKKREQA